MLSMMPFMPFDYDLSSPIDKFIDTAVPDFSNFLGKHFGANATMQTDIIKEAENYKVKVDLPGFSKEEITVKLDNGVLSISAGSQKSESKDETDKSDGKCIHRERFSGTSCYRSFTVDKSLARDDLKAKFENGVLEITFPIKEISEKPESKLVSIEG
jgi:HSP20 family molecular chaperone IbpA